MKKILGLGKDFVDEYERVADYIIIESSRELSLISRRILNCPAININLCEPEKITKINEIENKNRNFVTDNEKTEIEREIVRLQAILTLQKFFRMHKDCELYKLRKIKKLRDDISKLLFRNIKIIGDVPYVIEFYKTIRVENLLVIRNLLNESIHYELPITNEVFIMRNNYKALASALVFHDNELAIQQTTEDFYRLFPYVEEDLQINKRLIRTYTKLLPSTKLLEKTKKIGDYDYHLQVSEDPLGYKVNLRAFAKPRRGA